MKYSFHSGAELLALCQAEGIPLSEVMLLNEMEASERPREALIAEMGRNLAVMRASIAAGLNEAAPPRGVLSGGDALRLLAHAPESALGESAARVAAAAMAVVETNASMGRIVAAPTAGASGILPAVLLECGERQRGLEEAALVRGLFAAGAIGCVIAEKASIAGASGGCQAETGTAAAMAAGALAELSGGSPEAALTAAAIALKNCLGLVCDPVAGLVECPCIKRNAIAAVNALLSCDLALAGVESLIPFDEVVEAARRVGAMLSPDLRETAKGGLAATPTGKRIKKELTAKRGG